ncbi:MAG: type IV pilin N-terminal domain-containing protein [Methanoculleus sp.]
MNDDAVSEIVGEMIMISLVLLLVAVFAVSLGNLLPTERAPTVNVMMDQTDNTITLYHKGGDWVQAKDLEVIVSSGSSPLRKYRNPPSDELFDAEEHFTLSPKKQVFDIGSSITVTCEVIGDETVRLVTPRVVIFSGEVG